MSANPTPEWIDGLLASVLDHPQADFYRNHWGKLKSFSRIPTVSRNDFQRTPLSKRRYAEGRSQVKIVHSENGPFLSEWSINDIEREPFGLVSERPMVYLSDSYEALEKSLWCYTHGMVPLIGESDPDLAAFAAKKYQIDSVITDVTSLAKLSTPLDSLEKPLASITVLGDVFLSADLVSFAARAKRVRLLLALPELGACAEADLSDYPRFTLLPDCIAEEENDFLVVTKQTPLMTPIIRYRTTLPYSLFTSSL